MRFSVTRELTAVLLTVSKNFDVGVHILKFMKLFGSNLWGRRGVGLYAGLLVLRDAACPVWV